MHVKDRLLYNINMHVIFLVKKKVNSNSKISFIWMI